MEQTKLVVRIAIRYSLFYIILLETRPTPSRREILRMFIAAARDPLNSFSTGNSVIWTQVNTATTTLQPQNLDHTREQ